MEATLTKVSINTSVLQDLVTRASKGSTMVDIIPISCLMQLKIKDGKLYVKTSDNINFMSIYTDIQTDVKDFEIVVESKLFQQIISKLTQPVTSLSIEGNMVVIVSNGTYNVPLALDADGSKISFPEPQFEATGATKVLTGEEVRSILSLNKSCKSEMKEIPAIFNYYMDSERVFTTNVFKACNNPMSVFDSPVCLPPSLVELIPQVCDESGVSVAQDSSSVMFFSSKGELYGKKCLDADLQAFPADKLIQLFNVDMKYQAKLNRSLLLGALDRMCLFVSSLESNRLYLDFDSTGVTLHSGATKSFEKLNYIPDTPVNIESPISICIDSLFLKSQLTSCDKEELLVKFEADKGIQIQCGNATMALCILEEE